MLPTMRIDSRRSGFAAIVIMCLLLVTTGARADDQAGAGIARVSSLNGTVSMQHGDGSDTFAAMINAPLAVGDYVNTAKEDARAELQLDDSDFVRVAPGTQLRFTQLDPQADALQLAAGTVEVSELASTDLRPRVDTPSIGVQADRAGRYRVSVTNNGDTVVTVRSGRADLISPQGTQTITVGNSVVVSGASSSPTIKPISYVSPDGFDQWNSQRDAFLLHTDSGPYTESGIVGLEDLNQYGHWVDEPEYGQVWVAYDQPAGWAPYHNGHWVWQPYYGWTWVAYEPWGWAPYHYGNWFYGPRYGWAWYPGPVYVRPVWRPALVTFFGFGGGGGGFNFNLSFGNVGWVPLAPYEEYHPWWGPEFERRTIVYNNITNITNVNITRVYRNARVPGAIAVVNANKFTSATPYHYVPVRNEDLRSVALVKSALPIVPSKQNIGYATLPANERAKLPLTSPRFHAMKPVKQQLSFEQQRSAAQTATEHLYPSMHETTTAPRASTIHGGPSSPWSRFNGTVTGPRTNPTDTGPHPNAAGTVQAHYHPYAPATNNWKFAPSANRYAQQARTPGTKSKPQHTTKHPPANQHPRHI